MNTRSASMKKPEQQSFGHLLGFAPGSVAAYSSDYPSASKEDYPKRSDFRNYVDGIYMGYKWQCVEFARRWMYLNKGYIFDDVAMAFDIFNLRSVRDIKTNTRLPLHAFRNGNRRHPEVGSLLIWNEGGEFEVTGHVAVITEVSSNHIRIGEQNTTHYLWQEGSGYSRQLHARIDDDNEYWISCSYGDAEILGWMIQTGDDTYAEPTHSIDPHLFSIKTFNLPEQSSVHKSWLNIANADESAFVDAMGGHSLTHNKQEQGRYFTISEEAEQQLEHATNELHNLFMHATDYVLANDDLLKKFNLPASILPKIRTSWDNRLNELITSRFDFAMTEQGIKVYEYNCDSASCYLEAGKIQGKWFDHQNIDPATNAGKELFTRLVKTWAKNHTNDLIHILRDDDPEEKYHALFMQSVLESAGIRSKLIVRLDGLSWNEQGDIIDKDNEPLKWVWKTWAWETALDQLRSEENYDINSNNAYEPDWQSGRAIRLADVLLRENIMVYEPLWSLIPSNKAILPVLWQLFPNHPLLLNSAFEINSDLRRSGYVIKPIVGRCGANISLIDKQDRVIEQTAGDFDTQQCIYQQLYALPKIDSYYTQISTFTAAGLYAGTGVRADSSMVINKDSDCFPLRIIDNERFISISK